MAQKPRQPDTARARYDPAFAPALALAALFLAVYAFDCGQGFITDDFNLILHGAFDGPGALWRIFTTSVGFYRPLVSLTFGVNHWLFGLDPIGYGLFNLALAGVCAVLVWRLARGLDLANGLAIAAAALWLFNFHGINMSVLWLSGRSSLLSTAFSLLAAIAWLRPAAWPAALACLAAMFSKEEAVTLPVLFSSWALILRRGGGGPDARDMRLRDTAPLWLALGIYLACRASTDAFWIGSAPEYYRPAVEIGRVAVNVAHYADRSMTFSAMAVLLCVMVVRRVPWPWPRSSRIAALGAAWIVTGFALTVFLPVRSSLYAVFPSVGVALVAAAVIGDVLRYGSPRTAARLGWSGILLVGLLLPVYWSRNVRWTELAKVSSSVSAQLALRRDTIPTGSSIVIVDDDATRANLRNAGAGHVPQMARLVFGDRWTIEVVAPGTAEVLAADAVVLEFRGGQLRERPPHVDGLDGSAGNPSVQSGTVRE